MEAQKLICFEFKKEDRVYSLQMPHGAPLAEAYEASAEFLGEMVRMINEHAQQAVNKQETEVVEPEIVE